MHRNMNFVAGDLMQEIREQDLMAPVGGVKDGGAEPQSISIAISLSVALSAWSNWQATRKYGCGAVLTVSAECNGSGTPCN